MRAQTTILAAGLFSLAAILSAPAVPGTISTTLTPAGSIPLGSEVLVTLRISGYTDTNEIDGFNLTVSYPSALFSFVAGSFDLGTGAGPDQQWLSKATQESVPDGYSLANFNDGTTTPGVVTISMADLGYSSPEGGSTDNSGFLVAFKLLALTNGCGPITPAAFAGPTVLFDNTLTSVGVPAMSGVAALAGAAPALAIAPLGTDVVVSWPNPSSGFGLESSTSIGPGAVWTPVGAPVVIVGGMKTVTVPASAAARFFRLHCPP